MTTIQQKMADASSNNEVLRSVMQERQLTRSAVAKLLNVNDSTVDRWLVPPLTRRRRNPTFRSMPESKLRLFLLLVERA